MRLGMAAAQAGAVDRERGDQRSRTGLADFASQNGSRRPTPLKAFRTFSNCIILNWLHHAQMSFQNESAGLLCLNSRYRSHMK